MSISIFITGFFEFFTHLFFQQIFTELLLRSKAFSGFHANSAGGKHGCPRGVYTGEREHARMGSFSVLAPTNSLRLAGSNNTSILLSSGGWKSNVVLAGLKPWCGQGRLLETCGGTHPRAPPASRAPTPLAVTPPLPPKPAVQQLSGPSF